MAWSIFVTDSPTCATPALCSEVALLISAAMSATRRIASTTSVIVAPAWSTRTVPCATVCMLAPIRALISLAASALRWARLRTSLATTAKPRPCSPARAASTAALSARMLVWNAMPSITAVMSAIRLALSLMPFIVVTTWPTTAPPRVASVLAPVANWLAWRALSALCLTVEPSSSIAAAVACSALAWVSVRCDRSMLPEAISREPMATPSAPALSVTTMPSRLALMRPKAVSNWPTSSVDVLSIDCVRSPSATRSATATARRNGRTTLRWMR